MQEILYFLKVLEKNNQKDWFDANKKWYKEIQLQFNQFTEQLIEGISSFDPDIRGLQVKDCIYRIYRDTRFSHNKTPYKTHIGAYVCRGGKSSGYAGYYFHIEPKGDGFIGGSLLSAGLYCPEPKVLKSVREEIYANGAAFEKTLKQAKSFLLEESNKLKRPPKGFPESPYMEYLKLKDFSLMSFFDEKRLKQDDLLNFCLQEYKKTKPFNDLLNTAVHYAKEEDTEEEIL